MSECYEILCHHICTSGKPEDACVQFPHQTKIDRYQESQGGTFKKQSWQRLKAKDCEWPAIWVVCEVGAGYGQRRPGVVLVLSRRIVWGGHRADAQFFWIALFSSTPLHALILSTELPPFKNSPFLSLSMSTSCHSSLFSAHCFLWLILASEAVTAT